MKPFPWRAGMISIDGHRVLAVGSDGLPSVWAVERYGAPRIIPHQPFMGDVWTRARPDPKDGATRGALLDAIREAFVGCVVYLAPVESRNSPAGSWRCWVVHHSVSGYSGATEFDALLAAWEAAP